MLRPYTKTHTHTDKNICAYVRNMYKENTMPDFLACYCVAMYLCTVYL